MECIFCKKESKTSCCKECAQDYQNLGNLISLVKEETPRDLSDDEICQAIHKVVFKVRIDELIGESWRRPRPLEKYNVINIDPFYIPSFYKYLTQQLTE